MAASIGLVMAAIRLHRELPPIPFPRFGFPGKVKTLPDRALRPFIPGH